MTSAPAGFAVESQADALVGAIERKLAERERELLDAAAAEAAAIRQRARIKARRQMRRAIEELRASERQRMLRQRAELETAARQQASVQAQRALAAAWPQLAPTIAALWHDPAVRQRWMRAQIVLARARLPASGQSWLLHHPAAWRDTEINELLALLQAHGITNATLRADPGVATGLVIEADGARLDSTAAALLADRARVEAALLAALDGAVVHT